jgi:hypothetical protein
MAGRLREDTATRERLSAVAQGGALEAARTGRLFRGEARRLAGNGAPPHPDFPGENAAYLRCDWGAIDPVAALSEALPFVDWVAPLARSLTLLVS